MEMTRKQFIENELKTFFENYEELEASKEEQARIVQNMLAHWNPKYDVLLKPDLMGYLIQQGVKPSLVFQIIEQVRKGKEIRPEWEETLQEKGILISFIEDYVNTPSPSHAAIHFQDFLIQHVEEGLGEHS